jgi:hypothetical protein
VDAREKSFDAAVEASRLLITLSTGGLAVGLAVLNSEVGKATTMMPVSSLHKAILAASMVVLMAAVGLGVWTQLAVTQVLSEGADGSTDVWDRRITFPFRCQIGAFLLGVAALVGYGIVRLTGW